MPKNDPTVTLERFRGVTNVERDAKLPEGWLTDAENVDITDSGALTLRPGYAPTGLTGSVTAAYTTDDENEMYIVMDETLYRVDSIDPLALIALETGISTDEIFWAEAGDQVFFTGAASGIVDQSSSDVMPFGIPSPDLPTVRLIAGSLFPGKYQFALILRDEYGREGGARTVVQHELSETGGFQIECDIPDGFTGILYASQANGETLYRLGETAGLTTWEVESMRPVLLESAQMNAYPPPDGVEHVAFTQSRVWVSVPGSGESHIYPSKPFWYNLFDWMDYIAIPGTIRMMVGLDQGLVIGTDDAIYAYSPDGVLHDLADYGVVPGQPMTDDGSVYFWSKRGLCAALPFQNLTDDAFSVPHGARAAVGLSERDGRKMAIVATDTSGIANNPHNS